MHLTKDFVSKYNNLPAYYRRGYWKDYVTTTGKYRSYWRKDPLDRKNEWNLSKNDINSYMNDGLNGIDFLWQAIVFNLFIKIIKNYSPENLKYCVDFLTWRFKLDIPFDTTVPLFRGKFKNFVDDKFSAKYQSEAIEKVRDHSLKNMNTYVVFLWSIFDLMEQSCCKINGKEVVLGNIDQREFFRSEFSEDPKDLSFIFYKTILEYK